MYMVPCHLHSVSAGKASSCFTEEETEGDKGHDLFKVTGVHEVMKLMPLRVSGPWLGPWCAGFLILSHRKETAHTRS